MMVVLVGVARRGARGQGGGIVYWRAAVQRGCPRVHVRRAFRDLYYFCPQRFANEPRSLPQEVSGAERGSAD